MVAAVPTIAGLSPIWRRPYSCHIISPEDTSQEGKWEPFYNARLAGLFGATVEKCPLSLVAETIERRKLAYEREGRKPYFIAGGGHGNPGTEGYVKAYREILAYEKENQVYFDYIFHPSGTGTTQAGLVCGKLLSGDKGRKIIGISIARQQERGREVVKDSIREYLGARFDGLYGEEDLVFTDAYRLGGYGQYNEAVKKTIEEVLCREAIPMDTTYVGKAFYGMCQYVEERGIRGKNILFIHTGGTPLFFDFISKHFGAVGGFQGKQT